MNVLFFLQIRRCGGRYIFVIRFFLQISSVATVTNFSSSRMVVTDKVTVLNSDLFESDIGFLFVARQTVNV